MSGLFIPPELIIRMKAHCNSVYPQEACGILSGKGNVVEKLHEMTNTDQSNVSYLMDPAEQFRLMKELRGENRNMLAIYHSHPVSPPYPSSKDIALASYPDLVYVIVGLSDRAKPEIRSFEISEGAVKEVHISTGVDRAIPDEP
jgi:[CysO sulfur-carrier protein]-S-L-cysteine hydrolase